jgi:hypothetical protein
MEEKCDVKCTHCKTYRYEKDFISDRNRRLKTCSRCREFVRISQAKHKCEHNKQKSLCKDCGGSHICEHNRIKGQCIDCGGSQICEHNRIKGRCKDCGGSQICEHNRHKARCKDCGGSQFCEHNRQKDTCIDCGGSQICEHKRRKAQCKDCGGSQICEHDIRKDFCVACGGSQICEHKISKSECKYCCKDPLKLTIRHMVSYSKRSDQRNNRYDADRFIDKCFLEGLFEEYPLCFYDDCKAELQYMTYDENMATIGRINKDIGHIKSNCVLCCKKCNSMRKSNQTTPTST